MPKKTGAASVSQKAASFKKGIGLNLNQRRKNGLGSSSSDKKRKPMGLQSTVPINSFFARTS
jgi:hypothetical protein